MDSRTSRVLVAVLVGSMVAVAGCGAVLGSSETEILVVNNDDGVEHDVSVEILNDGAAVYSEETTVTGEANEELGVFEGSGEYTVAVTVDGETTTASHAFSESEDTLSVGVQNDGSVVIGG